LKTIQLTAFRKRQLSAAEKVQNEYGNHTAKQEASQIKERIPVTHRCLVDETHTYFTVISTYFCYGCIFHPQTHMLDIRKYKHHQSDTIDIDHANTASNHS
jgi:hypothetical protein